MGGYGSGGSNKKKRAIEQFQRIDSYNKNIALKLQSIVIEKDTGVTNRKYFVCPKCKKPVRYLYAVAKYLVCRNCIGANYAVQQMSRDELAIERARKIFDKLKVDISDMCPMDFMQYRGIEKPKGMESTEYCKLMKELWKQQDIWLDCAMRILK